MNLFQVNLNLNNIGGIKVIPFTEIRRGLLALMEYGSCSCPENKNCHKEVDGRINIIRKEK